MLLFIFFLPFLAWGAEFEQSDAEWRERLGRERYNVMRRKSTEAAFSGSYLDEDRVGTYVCAGCGNPLFLSQDKYSKPGCGWPLFKQAVGSKNLVYREDQSLGFKRYEALCRRCESHLGHVFNDGPPPKHLRYTINSIALVLCLKNS
jgi:peptide-methionine (R)-S-oxide reductase